MHRETPRRIRHYFRRYRKQFLLGLVCLALTQAFTLAVPRLLKHATDAILAGDHGTVKLAAFGLVLAALLGAIVRILSRVLIFFSGRRVEYDMRDDLFVHLLRLDQAFYGRMPLAQVMSRMVNDLTQVRLLLGPGILNVTNTALVYAVVIPILFFTDVELTLLALTPLPVLLLLGRSFGRRMYALSRDAQERLGAVSAKVQENLSGASTVRAYRQEPREEERFLALSNAYLATNIGLARVRALMFPVMGLTGAVGGVVVLYVGAHRIADGTMSVGGFVEYSAYLAALTWPSIALGWMISLWQRGLASLERINEIFGAEPRIVDGAARPSEITGRIEVRGLSFAYPGTARRALVDIHLRIEPGELVVIVGRTGSGKSTLLRALARFVEVPRGSVFFDGQDAVDLPLEHVRGALGFAPQDAFLFSRTIHENVAFGAPDAGTDRVRESLELASFSTEVDAFPMGLETLVGERGVTLSGGQRQRAALARAILPHPPILLLDDTLSAVDTETESRILEGLTRARSARTLVLVTHRLAPAALADRIVVLDEGRVVEQGTEAELLANNGLYARMHRRQRIREELSEATRRRAMGDRA